MKKNLLQNIIGGAILFVIMTLVLGQAALALPIATVEGAVPRMPKGAVNYITANTAVTNIHGNSTWKKGVLRTVPSTEEDARVSFNLDALESLGEYVISFWTYLPSDSVDWGNSVNVAFGHGGEEFKIMKNICRYYKEYENGTIGEAARLVRSVSGGGAPVGENFKVDIHVREDLPDRPGKNAFSIYINGEIMKYKEIGTSIGNRIADPPRLILGATDEVVFSGIRIYKVDKDATAYEPNAVPEPIPAKITTTTRPKTTTARIVSTTTNQKPGDVTTSQTISTESGDSTTNADKTDNSTISNDTDGKGGNMRWLIIVLAVVVILGGGGTAAFIIMKKVR